MRLPEILIPFVTRGLLVAWNLFFLSAASFAQPPSPPLGIHSETAPETEILWIEPGEDGGGLVHLYFFYSDTCPHCRRAKPWLEQLTQSHRWIRLHALEVQNHPENARRFIEIAAAIGQKPRGVPTFYFCGEQQVGFDRMETTGTQIFEQLVQCRDGYAARHTGEFSRRPIKPKPEPVHIPGMGPVDMSEWSLPLMTLVIASLDAFNPCAFFVLMFLLSLLIHARRRTRMLIIGGTFVLFSGLIYFLFMAAWLNVFLWAGELQAITVAAGIIAVFMGLLNLKDYFWFKKGPSLSIPEKAKPGLFQRMRNLAQVTHLPTMLAATVTLAIAANSYELLCTAGFPMVFTRMLTLHSLSTTGYYLYLAAYNVIYIIPLAIIVGIFTWTLGSRKLQEHEGRLLKMLSGWMMLGFGGLLLFSPDLTQNLWSALALVFASVILTWGVSRFTGRSRGIS